ncbi:MAG: hypothetical protein LLG00_12575 [Planctomycetaceae bacterium]|nr:hypothetical protein [Planctomycetaceae bacterium]
MNQDAEHLRLLSIFHYIVAGLAALFACIPIVHLYIGLAMFLAPGSLEHGHKAGPEALRLIGLLSAAIAGVLILLGWTFAVCVFVAGRNLARRRRYTFCLVMAGLLCMFMPFGTVLGVLTIIVLMRPSVKAMFEQAAEPFVG